MKAAAAASVGEDFNDGTYTYKVTSADEGDLQVEVTGVVSHSENINNPIIPSSVSYGGKSYTVKSIGENAFRSLTIPVESYTVPQLKGQLTIPDSVTEIGEYAFGYCSGLTGTLTIPSGVTKIGESAFYDCSGFTGGLTIPDGVTKIEKSVFWGCSGFTDGLTIPDGVTEIGESAFYECSGLTGELTIPDGVTKIGESAFQGCSGLTGGLTIPDGVKEIGKSAFYGCSGFTGGLRIPDRVTKINKNAFYQCSGMDGDLVLPREITCLGEYVFCECGFTGEVTINMKDDGYYIGESGFRGCSNITSVKICGDVAYINKEAFRGCSKLEKIEVPVSMEAFQNSVFMGCNNLKKLSIRVSKNSTITPIAINDKNAVNSTEYIFYNCPADRAVTFLAEDGGELDAATLSKAVAAYKAAEDGDPTDNYWYGWELPEVTAPATYSVDITVNKDGTEWQDHGKTFALISDGGSNFINDYESLTDNTYAIYDTTNAADSTDYIDTGIFVTVNGAPADATIDYYTVTFWDDYTAYPDGTEQKPQIILSGRTAKKPTAPVKSGYTFAGWVTGNGAPFDFTNTSITATTSVYAKWIANTATTWTISATAGEGGSISPSGSVLVEAGESQTFAITPNENCCVKSITVDGTEVNPPVAGAYVPTGAYKAGETQYYTFDNVQESHTIAAAFEGSGGTEGNGGIGETGGTGGSSGTGETGGTGGTGGSSGTSGDRSNGSDEGSDSSSDSSAQTVAFNGYAVESSVIAVSEAPASAQGQPASGADTVPDNEPKTGDTSHVELYATVAMISGLLYLMLYFADKKHGMTEEEKKEKVAALVNWARAGSRFRKYAALTLIFFLLAYYHGIGKYICSEEAIPQKTG